MTEAEMRYEALIPKLISNPYSAPDCGAKSATDKFALVTTLRTMYF